MEETSPTTDHNKETVTDVIRAGERMRLVINNSLLLSKASPQI